MPDGRFTVGAIGFHQVHTGQKFVGGIDALEIFAGDAHEARQPRARTDKHGVKPFLAQQLVDRNGSADNGVGCNFHAECTQPVYLLLDDRLGQTEFRNAIDQHAARRVQCFKHRHGIAAPCKVTGAGKSRRSRTDHRHAASVLLHCRLCSTAFMRIVPVGNKAFESADADRFALDAAHALSLALIFLRTDASAHGR